MAICKGTCVLCRVGLVFLLFHTYILIHVVISQIKTSAIQKRKSNLMYLAHQAQDRRDILAEQYAQNRKTKREAKMKYGKE